MEKKDKNADYIFIVSQKFHPYCHEIFASEILQKVF